METKHKANDRRSGMVVAMAPRVRGVSWRTQACPGAEGILVAERSHFGDWDVPKGFTSTATHFCFSFAR